MKQPLCTATHLLSCCALGAVLAGCAVGPAPHTTQSAVDAALRQARDDRPRPKVPDRVAQALLPQLAVEPLAQAAVPEQRFDLAVTAAPAAQVFHAIVSGSRYSMLLPPVLAGSVTLNLKEVSVREALEVMRELYGYEFRFEGSRIYVQQAALQTRIFQVAYPAARRVGRSDTRVVSGSISSNPSAGGGGGGAAASGGGNQEGSQISTTSDTDFWKELEASLKAIVGSEAGRQVVMSQHSGVLVVRGFPRDLRDL